MKSTSEQLLTFAENELVHKESIRQAVLNEAPRRQKKPVAWTKILLPIAACLVLLCGVVFAIPSARAEVLRWFRSAHSADYIADYLAASEDERQTNPDLDPLLASPDGSDAATLPIVQEGTAVNSPRAREIAAFLNENCDIALGEALYDGEEIYQSIRLSGLSGLYLLEKTVGGTETAIAVDPAALSGMYGEGDPEPYRSGEKTMYARPNGYLTYELPDGSRHRGVLELTGAVTPYASALQAVSDDAVRNEKNQSYLLQEGLSAVARITPCVEDWENYWERQADADGNLTVKVFYDVSVVEEDRGDGAHLPTKLYSAELGTVTVKLNAYQKIEQRAPETTDLSVCTWGPETLVLGQTEQKWIGEGLNITFAKHRVSMEGVNMKLDTSHATVNALGIRRLKIHVTVPQTWTWAQRKALFEALSFKVLINGESGDWRINCAPSLTDSGAIVLSDIEVVGVPHELLSSIEIISFCPVIRIIDHWTDFVLLRDTPEEAVVINDPEIGRPYNIADGNPVDEVNPAIGEPVTVHFPISNFGYSDSSDSVEYPAYAITLNVH